MTDPKNDTGSLSPDSTLGQRIQDQRLRAGLTKSGLARRLEVSDVTVAYWERGVIKQIGHRHVLGLAKTFGITASELLADPQLRDYQRRIRHEVLHEMIETGRREGRPIDWLADRMAAGGRAHGPTTPGGMEIDEA
ncbi:helix-turn-helix domain-containing protein [Modicisalibacter coralii]|uniref:helix-turn-helix domain-containing protein n=1 Tax=Modicisalibacter coralii TaxID=2304602 RepID=UPI00100BD270|nr:helix-turn-helix domain-containing protein [Halomonas coralii]